MPEKSFCQLLADAIKDEEEAQKFYEDLAGRSIEGPCPGLVRDMIENIKRDEEGHLKALTTMHYAVCRVK